MAVTKGHGNPKWTRDETILALDLYFDSDGQIPSSNSAEVIELSDLLRCLPYHAEAARKASFRNPDRVAFKLQNLRQIATGKGLSNTSKMDALIWEELGQNKEQTKLLATLIRTGVQVIENTKDEIDEDDYFTEGRVVTETHRRRERNPQVRSKLIEQRKTQDELKCDICDCGPVSDEPGLAECIFEAHHIIPLSTNA